MTNPYAQVARTYVGQLVFQVVFAGLLVAVVVVLLMSGDMGFRAWPVVPLGLALYVISIFVTQHAVNQFSNPRARLLPGFNGPQLAVPDCWRCWRAGWCGRRWCSKAQPPLWARRRSSWPRLPRRRG